MVAPGADPRLLFSGRSHQAANSHGLLAKVEKTPAPEWEDGDETMFSVSARQSRSNPASLNTLTTDFASASPRRSLVLTR